MMKKSRQSKYELTSKDEKKKSKKEELQPIPIQEIHNHLVQTTDGYHKMVLKITDTINCDLLSDDDIIQAVESIQSCLNGVKLNNAVQILISSERIDIKQYFSHLEQRAQQAKEEEDAFLLERIIAKKKFLQHHSQTARNVHNFYLVLHTTQKNAQEAYAELYDMSLSIVEYLGSSDMRAVPAYADEIMKVCYEKLNPNTSATQPFTPDINLLSIRPPAIRDHSGAHLEVDGMYHTFYTFSHFPEEVGPTWLKRIIGTNATLDLSILLRPTDKSQFIRSTNNKIIELDSKLLGKLPPMYEQKYGKQRESLLKLLEELQADTENLFDTCFVLCVKENSLDELKSAEKRLETAVASSRLRSKKLVFRGTKLVWYLLPICHGEDLSFERQISWPMQSTLVASILPFNSSELNYSEGILKGMNGKTESPVIYNRYNNLYFNNPNEVVFGESGSGKSYYLRLDMLRQSTIGGSDRIFVIDPEREYFIPGSERIMFRLGSSFTTNPFHIRSTVVDSDGREDGENDVQQYLRRKVAEMMSFFAWICPDLSAIEKGYLTEGIQQAYAEKGLSLHAGEVELPSQFPTLQDLVRILKTHDGAQHLIATMKPYVDGPYSSMFNGQTNWDMKNKVTVLDIHELSDEVKRPLMDLLLKEIWEEMKIDRTERKGFYVDEAWLLADEDNQQTMKFLREIAKRVRKYGGFLTTATQNVDDFLTIGKYGTAIFNNASIKTFMRMSEKDIEELSKFMNFSEKELVILGKRKEQGHCIHVASGKRIEMKVKSSPDEIKVLGLEDPAERLQKQDRSQPSQPVRLSV
jgi:conjugal transfer ATP-binding protein TraC